MHRDSFQPFKADSVDELIDQLGPYVEAILLRVDVEEFTTPDFIRAMLTDPEVAGAYHQAVAAWGEEERASKMVIHGQVIPTILRKSTLVTWAGFAYGEDDEFAVPAWWKRTSIGR